MNTGAVQLRRTRAAIYGPPLTAFAGFLLVAIGAAGLADRDTVTFPDTARVNPQLPAQFEPRPGSAPVAPPAASKGYMIVSKSGKLQPGGRAIVPAGATIVGATRAPARGYWLATANGRVIGVGVPGSEIIKLERGAAPIVGIAAAPDGGYWLAARDGHVYAVDTSDLGNIVGIPADAPVVGIAAAPDGGYWLAQSDGTVSAFGAADHEDLEGVEAGPVVGIAAAPTGGYWLATRSGEVFGFGPPTRGGTDMLGSAGPVVAIAADSSGGYVLATAEGGVYEFGDAATAKRVDKGFGPIAAIVPR
jgi:hypothetical protein